MADEGAVAEIVDGEDGLVHACLGDLVVPASLVHLVHREREAHGLLAGFRVLPPGERSRRIAGTERTQNAEVPRETRHQDASAGVGARSQMYSGARGPTMNSRSRML